MNLRCARRGAAFLRDELGLTALAETRRNGQNPMIEWLPVAMVIALASAMAIGLAMVSNFLGIKRPSSEKLMPYECGVPPVGSANERHSVRFYLIAMLFILFDIEVVFLYPWSTVFHGLGWFGLWEMAVFIAILVLGYIYAWKKGALEWQ